MRIHVAKFDLLMVLASALDLVSSVINEHHKRVAYIALMIAREMGLPETQQNELFNAAAMHDVGAMSLSERIAAMDYDYETEASDHTEVGYRYLNTCEIFRPSAAIVRFHHLPWKDGAGRHQAGEEVPFLAHLLHLADRAEVLINKDEFILDQVDDITATIKADSGWRYHPEMVEAFLAAARREAFWLDATSPEIKENLARLRRWDRIELGADGLLNFAEFIACIIDMRCEFTATHSSGVAASAEVLARLMGFDDTESRMMRVAGLLHDIGKLAVPLAIIDKAGPLSAGETNLMRSHTYHTRRILGSVPELATVNEWASNHHEQLDGNGYPFHLSGDQLSPGARILAVADKFTAMAEKRPYRDELPKEALLGELAEMAARGVEASEVFEVLRSHYDAVDGARREAQETALDNYLTMWWPMEEMKALETVS